MPRRKPHIAPQVMPFGGGLLSFLVQFLAIPFILLGWLLDDLSPRRRRWKAQGRCEACGYDLRASTIRCPECGRWIAPRRRPWT
jgi:lipopolysaccharide biosynthesis regulator YciM